MTQSPAVNVPVVVTNFEVLPLAVPEVNGDGRRAVFNVPLEMLDAFSAVRFVPTPDEGVPSAPS